MSDGAPEVAHRRRRVRPEVRWGLMVFLVLVIAEFVIVPEVVAAHSSLKILKQVDPLLLVAGVGLECAALAAYTKLTQSVLPRDLVAAHPEDPSHHRVLPMSRIARIDLTTLAVSHVVPGGTGPGTALAYRLFTQAGANGTDAAFALTAQGAGSAVVLNALFWVVLVVSLFLHGYNVLYGIAAGIGVLLFAAFGGVVFLLLEGRRWAVEAVCNLAGHLPFLDGQKIAGAVERFADRLRSLVSDRRLLRDAVVWAAANWLLDAASLWVFLAAFHRLVSPIDLLVAYGLANILAVIPITPGGLGIIEGVLIGTLVGFGVPRGTAPLAVLAYRLVNFWLPIPVGAACYVSLRIEPPRGPKGPRAVVERLRAAARFASDAPKVPRHGDGAA